MGGDHKKARPGPGLQPSHRRRRERERREQRAVEEDADVRDADIVAGVDGDLDELDAPGEWHWEGGVLYLYPPSWANPAMVLAADPPDISVAGPTLP